MKKLFLTGFALLALWGVSFGLSYVDLGRGSLAIALGIAAIKAAVVGATFMELLRARTAVRLTMIVAGALAVVLVGLVLGDVMYR